LQWGGLKVYVSEPGLPGTCFSMLSVFAVNEVVVILWV
jgi:hypothetical protein